MCRLLLALCLVVTTAEAAQMYRWVDENGVTHYSFKRPDQGTGDQPELKGGQPQAAPGGFTGSDSGISNGPKRLIHGGWQGCASDLCSLVRQIDPDCSSHYCSDAKRYSDECRSVTCQANKLAFEREMRDRVQRAIELRSRVPTPKLVPEPPRPSAPPAP